jgi:thioesterase domain-containing protein
MSECPPIAIYPLPPAVCKPGSVGVLAGPEVAIWDDCGAPLAQNCSGHVLVRGPNVSPGYYDDAAANQAAFTDGWFRTGDCGYLDDDGFLFLTGRISEFINRGGEKVAPAEIDDVFIGHPDVAQAATFAVCDGRLGEDVATAIVPTHAGALTVQQLRRFAATRLTFHKIPRRIYLVPEIPRGRTGKPNRAALRARFEPVDWQPDEQTVPHVPPRTDLERKIAKVWADVLGVHNPGIHDNFFDSGGDSLATVTFLTGLSEELVAERLTAGVLVEAPTIAELAVFLSRTGKGTHSSILPLQPAGGGAPLFWIGGFPAPSVVNALDRNRPVFLLSMPDSPNQDASQIIDRYAEECFQTLRRFRPKGPYLLAGFCVASVIVIEMARRLREEGDDVGLILFDARCVLRHNTGLTRSLWISSVRLTQNLLYHSEKLLEVGASNAAAYVAARMRTVFGRVRRILLDCWRKLLGSAGSDLPAVLRNSQLLFSIALRHYQPKPYAGRIVHIWAADRPKGQFRDLTYEWGSVGKGRMELYEVPGNHISMFQGENGETLGRILNDCLNDIEPDVRLNGASSTAIVTAPPKRLDGWAH